MSDEQQEKEPFSINQYKENEKYFVHLFTLENLGKAIREVRLKRNFSQKEFANILGIAGSTLSKLENNDTDPKLSTILKVFERLHTKVYFQVELQRFWKEFNAQKIRERKNKNKKNR